MNGAKSHNFLISGCSILLASDHMIPPYRNYIYVDGCNLQYSKIKLHHFRGCEVEVNLSRDVRPPPQPAYRICRYLCITAQWGNNNLTRHFQPADDSSPPCSIGPCLSPVSLPLGFLSFTSFLLPRWRLRFCHIASYQQLSGRKAHLLTASTPTGYLAIFLFSILSYAKLKKKVEHQLLWGELRRT